MKLCVIPARGGSKRIPRKNIKDFCGKPMISYSIQAAIDSGCFDKVIVSTDDQEVSEVAESLGAEIPFMRPEELADDYTGTLPVIKHALERFEAQGHKPIDVCILYATAPFVQSSAIREAYVQFKGKNADYCFTVTSFAFPIQRAVKVANDKHVEMFYPKHINTRSQDLEEAYHDAGQFYWGNAEAIKHEKPIFSSEAIAFILPRYLVQDVDTLEDWTRAEYMYQALKRTGEL